MTKDEKAVTVQAALKEIEAREFAAWLNLQAVEQQARYLAAFLKELKGGE